MDRFAELQYRIDHLHKDGSREAMVEQRSHHDAADHDPERQWGLGRIFKCTTCDESVAVTTDAPGAIEGR